jgi:CHAD domain-containing protein
MSFLVLDPASLKTGGTFELRTAGEISNDFFEKGSFGRRYEKARRSVRKKLVSFTHDPSEGNTHNVRTAVRKMNAALELLPKKRSKKARQLVKKYKKVMKKSAATRDLDIIAARISRHPQSPARKALLIKLKKARKKSAKKAKSIISPALELKLREPDPKEITPPKLQKRFSKALEDLTTRLNSSLPIVLEDPTNAEEIHSLRKYCKKLRYLFELVSEKDSEIVRVLKSWQDILGTVHDGDVTISYLVKMKKNDEIKEMIATELRDRNHDYEKFVQTCLRA